MGNSTALPYDILEAIEYSNNNSWSLHNGSKKENKQSVGIFKFSKKERPDRIGLAQKNVQKIRTIRHPYVLTYVDSMDTDEDVILITEPCTPLEIWLKKVVNDPLVPKQNLFSELTWGFRCILKAIDFLHANCTLLHGNLGLHSLFVTPNGDWKIGAFELSCNVNNNDEVSAFISNHFILDNAYIAPERSKLTANDSHTIESVLKAKVPPYYIDMYSFGQCVSKTFVLADEELKGSLEKYITLTIHPDMKKRPKAKKLLETAIFNSDYIKILENIQEFSLKSPKEIIESIGQLDPLLPQMAIAICNHKLLPSLCKVLHISINDFQIRDSREAARQAIVTVVELLSKLAHYKKIESSIFQQDCMNLFTQLWAMTDRTIRTALLTTLKNLAELFPASVVNKSIFDNIIAGFSDSNAKLRESTLMSLIYIVDKLEESALQDRLVRCICNLQNDPEASIRTNAIIFLGKIANKLKETVRNRILCNALSKSMKDNFSHCRLAGLKTSIACMKLLEVSQIALKIIPTVSILLLDRAGEIRSLSITLMDASIQRLKEHHHSLIEAEKEAATNRQREKDSQSATAAVSTPMSESILNMQGWTSWLSKTTDTAAVGTMNSNQSLSQNDLTLNEPSSPVTPSLSRKANSNDDFMSPMAVKNRNDPTSHHQTGAAVPITSKGWDDDDFDSALANDQTNNNHNSNLAGKKTPKRDEFGFDDDFDPNMYDEQNNSNDDNEDRKITVKSSAGKKLGLESAKATPSSGTTNTTTISSKIVKPAKVAVKKLEFKKDEDWEDF